MCGRFTITMQAREITDLLERAFDIEGFTPQDIPRYNIAPSMSVIALFHDGVKYRAGHIPWGFQFERANKSFLAFNTRIETIREKPFFKQLYDTQRMVFLSNGYFEWDVTNKTPYWLHYADHAPMFLGSIWHKKASFESSIITLEAPESLASIHPRVPFSMPLKHVTPWLLKTSDDPLSLGQIPTQIDRLSRAVNTVSNNDASILNSSHQTVL